MDWLDWIILCHWWILTYFMIPLDQHPLSLDFSVFGESGFVDVQDMEQKLVSIREKIDKFPMKDVFNMDETGLFYRLQADHSLATKQLEGRKQDKERLTVVICCNEDGSEKIPLWIIGKYAKPRCFKNVNMNSLDYQYRANKKAWIAQS